jgi:hypothetical protein
LPYSHETLGRLQLPQDDLLFQLFHVQSSRWRGIAGDYLESLYNEIATFVKTALEYSAKYDQLSIKPAEITILLCKSKTNVRKWSQRIFRKMNSNNM